MKNRKSRKLLSLRSLLTLFLFFKSTNSRQIVLHEKRACNLHNCQENTGRDPKFTPPLTLSTGLHLPIGIHEWSDHNSVASFLDWELTKNNHLFGSTNTPHSIYIPYSSISYFLNEIIPVLNNSKIVLVIGREKEINFFESSFKEKQEVSFELWKRLESENKIYHIFSEVFHPISSKINSIPIGLNTSENYNNPDDRTDFNTSIVNKSFKILITANNLFTEKILKSEKYKNLLENCKKYEKHCEYKPFIKNRKERLNTINKYKFTVCLDLSMVFEVILSNTIPIIESTSLDDAYHYLPTVIVPKLRDLLTLDISGKMRKFSEFEKYFQEGSKWEKLKLNALGTYFWWDLIHFYVKFVNSHPSTSNTLQHGWFSLNNSVFEKDYHSEIFKDNLYGESKYRCWDFHCVSIEKEKIHKFPISKTLSTRPWVKKLVNPDILDNFQTIEGLFDWVLFHSTVDGSPWLFGNTPVPRLIYVVTQSIHFFAEEILPFLSVPFVLYTGNNDETIPYNIDLRYPRERRGIPQAWEMIINSPLVLHWFVENHIISHAKVSTMPIGMNGHEFDPDDRVDFDLSSQLSIYKRPLRMIQVDRIRTGPQWKDRLDALIACEELEKKTEKLCHSKGSNPLTHKEFIKMIQDYPFILCVHGGGIDPSPKAWEALIVGTIPIIEHSTLDDAYSQLPVVFVNNITDLMYWSNLSQVLENWVIQLGPYYEEGSKLRNQTLFRLTSKYWYQQVISYLPKNSSTI